MNHGDPQSTGRASIGGPIGASLQWQINSPSRSSAGVAITADSLIVTGYHLTAIDMSGSVKWTYTPQDQQDWVVTTPIVTAQGSIMGATNKGSVYCIDGSGGLLWQTTLGESVAQQGSNLGLDGTFYCVSVAHTLFAVTASGQIAWHLQDAKFNGGARSVLTFSPDGKTIYVPGVGVAVNAVDIASHSVAWRFGNNNELDLAPMVDCDGNVYVLGTDTSTNSKPTLFSLNPGGGVRWAFIHGNTFDQTFAGDPTLDAQGNIYFAFDTLYSVGFSGQLRWKIPIPASTSTPAGDVPLISDVGGHIYAIVTNLSLTDYRLLVLDNTGAILTTVPINPTGYFIDSSPAIIWGGGLVVAGFDNGKLYKF